ncbi:hypothetical protein IC619_013885 [Hazenella sp. IB182353]|nr:hypothetical protein [Polycladospora coralii]
MVVPSANIGWLRNEIRRVDLGQAKDLRLPRNSRNSKTYEGCYQLAHERRRESAKGFSYQYAHLQDRDLHKLQHKYDNHGRKSKIRPVR